VALSTAAGTIVPKSAAKGVLVSSHFAFALGVSLQLSQLCSLLFKCFVQVPKSRLWEILAVAEKLQPVRSAEFCRFDRLTSWILAPNSKILA
jgi:hypothetical protein